MRKEQIITEGEYLGYCPQKGDLYTIYKGTTTDGKKKYEIWSVNGDWVTPLIDFTGIL